MLAQAAIAFDAVEMQLYRYAALFELSRLAEARAVAAPKSDVVAWMTEQGIRYPARLCATLAPGFGRLSVGRI